MEEALYSDLGFFNTDQVRSDKEGDFLTSPEVSKYFGKIIRNWIDSKSNLKNIIDQDYSNLSDILIKNFILNLKI